MPVAPETSAVYELVSSNGYRAVFNNREDADYVGDLTEVTGLDSAEIREESENRPGTHGGLHGLFLFGRRPVTLTGKTLGVASTYERAQRIEKLLATVSNCLKTDGTLIWTLSSGQVMTLTVRLQQPPRVTGAWVKEFQLAMIAADPFIYDYYDKVASITYGDVNFGVPVFTNNPDYYAYTMAPEGPRGPNDTNALAFPWSFPLRWSTYSSGQTVLSTTAYNAGDAVTFPRVSITGQFYGSKFTVQNSTTGQRMTINTLMGYGDTLVIDFKNKALLRNGADARSTVDVLNSDWWGLQPGNNVINLLSDNTSSAPDSNSSLQLQWRDAWA